MCFMFPDTVKHAHVFLDMWFYLYHPFSSAIKKKAPRNDSFMCCDQ